MNTFCHVPPGFRFHPTDEELVDYYLRKKVNSTRIDLDVIKDVDLYKIEPWDLQELCRLGTEEQNEWYFFSHKDKKYPTGTRTNRATAAGFWKATGRDKAIYSKHDLIGMRKTLVFYKGRAPNGLKSDWIMHEYRLETDQTAAATPQEEGWVVCRVFKKRVTSIMRKMSDHDSPSCTWYDDSSFMHQQPDHHFDNSCSSSSKHQLIPNNNCDVFYQQHNNNNLPLHHLPLLHQNNNNPIMAPPFAAINNNETTAFQEQGKSLIHHQALLYGNLNEEQASSSAAAAAADWRLVDKFVSSQLREDHHVSKQELMMPENTNNNNNDNGASTSNSSCPIMDVWK
ncbi:hypothetical protein HN51_053137 [Arachis hypogaea]|uniref:NAC domain-containing protein n=1 Tax=Arachis hypogaea TaxID=3818 RepID=A0A444XBF9_ARAHY|nr:NAC domain-containing protein 7-like [Arachis ipaensis]XP_025657202.1 NAC domain-containing protein 7 [Arachis hypogaea]QHN75452.1 NAC domain-containing protein [Arachis hypogaea]RYQ87044.1 hypothetical protein Ahy_B09g094530 [Arachis hypogaea]